MKLLHTLAAFLLLFCLQNPLFGQKTSPSTTHLVKTYSFFQNPDARLNHQNFFEEMASQMHLSEKSSMVLTEQRTDKFGVTHSKFQQMHEGVPIFGARYILHEKDGRVLHANGRYAPLVAASAQPGISAETALAMAKLEMKAKAYHPRQAEPVLCFVDPAFPGVSDHIELAYQVDLHSTEPFDKRRYFVHAATGKTLLQFPLILNEGVPSTAKTRYYGTQDITTDSIGPQHYVLRDPTRGEGIYVLGKGSKEFTSTSSAWDLSNVPRETVALDAHFCTQEYYDMMLSDYDWQGLDGNGKALRAHVNDGYYVNAYWDGEASYYGDGDCNYGPLTTLEVVGHEFTHGMIDYTSRLVYSSESGAINESLADIFGKLLERKTDPANFSWDLGHSFILNPESRPFRVMDDPNAVQMPAYYKGTYWQDGGGVHTNSAIGNLWFTMLVDGKQGINEAGESFNVPALGPDKAGQIVFNVNLYCLTEGSDYNQFYLCSRAFTEFMYGAGSTEMLAVTEAWKAVGLPHAPPAPLFDLHLTMGRLDDKNHCPNGQSIPITFKVANVGTVAYHPSMMGSVTLSSFSQSNDLTVQLTEPIGPGEFFQVGLNNWLKADQPGFNFLSGVMDINDDNGDNNQANAYFNVAEYEANDLELYIFENEALTCFSTTQNVMAFILNNSCEAVPAGTVLSIKATDDLGNVLWISPPYVLQKAFASGSSISMLYDVPISSNGLKFTLLHASDPNLLNNEYPFYQEVKLPITGNYLNNFEPINFQDDYLLITNLGFDPIISYQNSRFFATTGVYEDPAFFQRCADPLDVFEFPFSTGINAIMRACLDLSAYPNARLEFDLAQFRNVVAEQNNDPYSCILQAKWEGSESGEQFFLGQTEGLVVNHKIALPPYFKGTLSLNFYTEVGQWSVSASSLANDDVLLLDNLRIKTSTSSAQDVRDMADVRVVPNPATNITIVSSPEGLRTVSLQSANGQILRTLELETEQCQLDLNGLSKGLYFLNIQLDNGQRAVKKLLIM